MTREVTVTLDKNDLVQAVEATGSRWRFQRIRPLQANHTRRKLSEEQEQAICAMYVDRPNLTTAVIGEKFGVVSATVSGVVETYGIPFRHLRNSRKTPAQVAAGMVPKPSLADLLPHPAGSHVATDTRPVWRVTLVRTVVEEIHAETLLDVAAHYDGTDARITKAELA